MSMYEIGPPRPRLCKEYSLCRVRNGYRPDSVEHECFIPTWLAKVGQAVMLQDPVTQEWGPDSVVLEVLSSPINPSTQDNPDPNLYWEGIRDP